MLTLIEKYITIGISAVIFWVSNFFIASFFTLLLMCGDAGCHSKLDPFLLVISFIVILLSALTTGGATNMLISIIKKENVKMFSPIFLGCLTVGCILYFFPVTVLPVTMIVNSGLIH